MESSIRTDTAPPVLRLEGVSMSFGAVEALAHIDLSVELGDVIGLVGDNGAGKSTLVKCISGVHRPTGGKVLLDGNQAELTADQARRSGIETVHQNLGLVGPLPVWENFFLNREPLRRHAVARALRIIDRKAMRRQTREALGEFDVDLTLVDREVANLSGGQRQIVAVIRALHASPRVVMLDEPTAALGVEQSALVLDLVSSLPERSVACIFISHNMQHVFQVANRMVVLRRGVKVADVRTSDTTPHEIVSFITGSDQVDAGFA